jgi:hypothetical protein
MDNFNKEFKEIYKNDTERLKIAAEKAINDFFVQRIQPIDPKKYTSIDI